MPIFTLRNFAQHLDAKVFLEKRTKNQVKVVDWLGREKSVQFETLIWKHINKSNKMKSLLLVLAALAVSASALTCDPDGTLIHL